ncbi:MAG: Serine/threonine exchanger SteT [Gemmatimonadaceae bacterium]|nr:Serine/threonine exchanger SteT [Gemmatimonadaceae bacterium]
MLTIWVLGGAVALCGALTLAEVATAIPATGGFYAFLRDAWGRLPAFLFGWSQLTIVRAAALGAIAITFSEYFLRVLGYDPTIAPYNQYAHYLAAVAIAVTAVFNIVGVRWGTTVTNLTTMAKFGGLVFIVLVAVTVGLPRTGGYFAPAMPVEPLAASSYGLALVSVLWAYDGWGDVSYVAGEVTDPTKNLPRALIGGTLAVIAIYLLANVAYLSVLTIEEMRVSKLVAADVAERLMGRPGVVLVSTTVTLSTFGTMSVVLLTSPRVLFAMADDGLLFRRVAAVHPRFQTPHVAISLVAVLGVSFVLLNTFEKLADTFVIAMLPFYAGGVGAIYRLRARPGYVPKFRALGYPVVPAIFLAAVAYLLVNQIVDPGTRMWALGIFIVILAGIPVYRLTVGRAAPR